MKKKIFCAGIIALLFSVQGVYCSLETKIDRYIKKFVKKGDFSGSVLVVKDGQIVLSKGYGMANYELDIPNSPKTKFRVGSITKQFTGAAIAEMQKQGLLNVNDPVSKYLSGYPRGNEIKIIDLVNHRAGIPNYNEFPEFAKKKKLPITLEELVALFKNKPLEFKPGTKFKYSNSGYVLLTYLIEKISGKTYEEFLKQNFFDKFGMKKTGLDNQISLLKDRASGYKYNKSKKEFENSEYIDMSWPNGAGALYSTVEDLYLWDRALHKNGLPFKIGDESEYSYGWLLDESFGKPFMYHGGVIEGFHGYIARYIKDNACIIILGNADSFSIEKMGNGLAAMIFGKKVKN